MEKIKLLFHIFVQDSCQIVEQSSISETLLISDHANQETRHQHNH